MNLMIVPRVQPLSRSCTYARTAGFDAIWGSVHSVNEGCRREVSTLGAGRKCSASIDNLGIKHSGHECSMLRPTNEGETWFPGLLRRIWRYSVWSHPSPQF